MTGWQKLWQDPEVVKKWTGAPPVDEVVMLADRLAAEGRRRVLDIGCGLGRHTVYLAARGFEVVAVDNAAAALSACKENLAKAGLAATVMAAEMDELPFPPGSFDGVLAAYVIHHSYRADIERIIGSITRLLAPAGLFVWVTPTPRHYQCGRGEEVEPGTWIDPQHPEGPTPHHYSTEQEVRELLAEYHIESLREHEYREGDNSRWHWCIFARKLA
jgi:SAM-dependent methyltransferase